MSVPADRLAQANTVYTVATKPFFLDRTAASPTATGDGKLLPAAKLAVVTRDGDWLQVRVDGWQQDGSPAAIDALKGQRILVAALDPTAVAKVKRGPGVEDTTTKLKWFEASLTVWISSEGLIQTLPRSGLTAATSMPRHVAPVTRRILPTATWQISGSVA